MSSTFNAALHLDLIANELYVTGNKRGPISSKILSDVRMATGTVDGAINKAFYKQYTGIGAGVTTSIDLVGAITDASGDTVNFDEVVLIFIRNLSSTAASLGGGAFFLWYNVAGIPAAASSTDILAITTGGSASAAAFEVLILGRDN